MQTSKALFLALAALALAIPPGNAQISAHALATQDVPHVPFHGNAACPVTGKPVDQDTYVKHDGQKIFTCSRACKAVVRRDAELFLAKAYPDARDLANAVCPIDGKPTQKEHMSTFQGRAIRFCSVACSQRFWDTPQTVFTLMQDKSLVRLQNRMCPVMANQEVLADLFIVYGKKVVSLCCGGCVKRFKKDPEEYMAALAAAQAQVQADAAEPVKDDSQPENSSDPKP